MKNQRGFVWIPVLIVLVVIAGAGLLGYKYKVEHQTILTTNRDPIPGPEHFSTPTDSTAVPLNPPYGCYAKTATDIYDIGSVTDVASFELPQNAQKVLGANVATFEEASPYGICFGVDKLHVYKETAILPWGDPQTFKLLWYAKPGPILFFRNGSKIVKYTVTGTNNNNIGKFSDIANGDPLTFVEMLGGFDFAPWAKDKNNVYCDGTIVAGADPKTAKLDSQGTHLLVTVDGVQQIFDSTCKTSPQTSVPEMSKYTDSDFGFSFWYPSAWKVIKSPGSIKVMNPSDTSIDQYYDGTWIIIDEIYGPNWETEDAKYGKATYVYDASNSKMTIVSQELGRQVLAPFAITVGGLNVYSAPIRYGGVAVPLTSSKLLVLSSPSGASSFVGAFVGTITALGQSPSNAQISAAFQAELNDHYYLQELCRQKGIADKDCKD